VGFGISTPQQAGEIARLADGVVMGSAVVKMMAENAGRDRLVQIVSSFAGEIKKAIQIRSKT
jgi:tryptophan synthase alpha chain